MPKPEYLQHLQTALANQLTQAVGVIAELGVADRMERGGTKTVAELASETGCHERSLYRCLRFLASHGVFAEHETGAFGLTPAAELLRGDAEDSFRAGAQMMARMAPAVHQLEHCLKTGKDGFSKAFNQPLFEYLSERPDDAQVFDAGMSSFHGTETPAMLEVFDFSGIGTLADVGGGNGSVLIAVLEKYPRMKGLLYDLGHVGERAQRNIAEAGLSERCEVREGSFFEAFPGGADAYFMRHILHDWTDEQCLQILGHCRAAIPSDGRLFIVEAVVPAGNDPSPAKNLDLAMMIFTGGLERTEQEYAELFEKSGFRLEGVTPTPSAVSVVEARPV